MATPDDPARLSLRIARTFAAPREKVFRAFVDAEAIAVWFAAPVNLRWTVPPELDPRTGGGYRFTVTDERAEKTWSIHGTYVEVRPPDRLVFTWRWENDPVRGDSGDTLVTVEFFDRKGRTEVVLTHERFDTEVVRSEHEGGWAECLDEIGKLVS